MQGNLQDFSPLELIQIIGTLGKSGVLRLQRITEEGMVAFRNGKIIYASSPTVRESLGSLLLARGLITEAQIGSRLEVSRSEQSILSRATDQQHSVLARLPTSDDDIRILQFLGGSSPSKSVAIPLSSEGQVILVLYGDHFADDIGTGRLEEVPSRWVKGNSHPPNRKHSFKSVSTRRSRAGTHRIELLIHG